MLAKKADENSGHDVVRPEKRFDWSTDFEIFQRFAAGDDPVRVIIRLAELGRIGRSATCENTGINDDHRFHLQSLS